MLDFLKKEKAIIGDEQTIQQILLAHTDIINMNIPPVRAYTYVDSKYYDVYFSLMHEILSKGWKLLGPPVAEKLPVEKEEERSIIIKPSAAIWIWFFSRNEVIL